MDLIATLNNNVLKLSIVAADGFKGVSKEIAEDVVSDSKILNSDRFAQQLSELVDSIPDVKKKNLELVFLLEPTEVYLRFVTISKNGEGEIDEQVMSGVKEKLEGINIDDLYYAHQKIAPFVYQFVGVRKDLVDIYLDVATKSGISLKAAIPWVMLLPKFLENNDPCVFIIKTKDRQTVALSELNGIYYCEDFDKVGDAKELVDLIQGLSVYKRSEPITNVYTVMENDLNVGDGFKITPLLELSEDFEDAKGYEVHLLVNEVLGKNAEYLTTQVNVLNLLPVPVVQNKRNSSLVYVGAVGAAIVVVVFGVALYMFVTGNKTEGDLEAVGESSEVLSDNNGTKSSSEGEESTEEAKLDLNRKDLTIRVENGAGVAGIAAETQDTLEELGYTVVGIGNADETGRDNTLLKFKSSMTDYKDMLVEDLTEEFELVVEEDLDEDEEHDVLMIVGLN